MNAFSVFVFLSFVLLQLLFGHRMLVRYREQAVLSSGQVASIVWVYVFLIVVLAWLFQSGFSYLVLLFLVLNFALLKLESVLLRFREKGFRTEFQKFMSGVLLQMSGGISLRESYFEELDSAEEKYRSDLRKVGEIVFFSQQIAPTKATPFVRAVSTELQFANTYPHYARTYLNCYLEVLKKEDDFRRRSGQALRQARAQSGVLGVLYLGILIFVVSNYGWRANQSIIVSSVSLYFVGFLVSKQVLRGYKWKV